MAKTTTKHCFSCGTDFMVWQTNNCEKCVKAVWYNEKTDSYPQYRCAIQGQLEGQLIGLYEISERTYNATQQKDCPYKKTERTKRPKKDNNPKLFDI